MREVTTPDRNACLNFLRKEKIVTGRNAKTENGQPRMTPVAATATAAAGFSKRKSADDSDIAYIENELGKKPAFEVMSKNQRTNMNYAENSQLLLLCTT